MKKETKIKIVYVVVLVFLSLFAVACGDTNAGAAEAASKYTDEVAQAISEGSVKIAASLFLGLIIAGILA